MATKSPFILKKFPLAQMAMFAEAIEMASAQAMIGLDIPVHMAIETRDRGSVVSAGRFSFDRGAAVRCQREPGFRLASAFWAGDRSSCYFGAANYPARNGPGDDWC